MAFSFVRNKTTSSNNGQQRQTDHHICPKLPSSQLNISTRSYPSWLKENAINVKQLPGIYRGVLGQVQLQAELAINNGNSNGSAIKLVSNNNKKDNPSEYMNRFTDTERVKQLLSMSRLSNETLATVWAYVNKTFPGRLTNREVCLALALIALFQKLNNDGKEYHEIAGSKLDPFNMIKTEKKPPVPTLYSCHDDQLKLSKNNQRLTSSNSVPSELNSSTKDCLLIDITGYEENDGTDASKQQQTNLWNKSFNYKLSTTNIGYTGNSNSINLIDTDSDKTEHVSRLTQMWIRIMTSMRAVFKRAFDILNVENSRQSALEALMSPKGVDFCKNLSLCYPIAHNIKFKVDELEKKGLLSAIDQDKNYNLHLDDLMISINEYWAVLINLFHESGLTNFIELIMDGLNRTNETVMSRNYEELLIELDSANTTCAICHTKFYLVNIGDALEKRELLEEDLKLVLNQELITNDERYYYHARCANFWLNNVDSQLGGKLPFHEQQIGCEILKPTSF